MATHGVPVAEDSSTGGESKLWQSWWSVHAPKLGLQVARKSYQRQGVSTVVLAPERRLQHDRSETWSLDGFPKYTTQ